MEHYQELFNHLYDNHGLILLQDEIAEIASRLNNSCGEDETQAVRPNEQIEKFIKKIQEQTVELDPEIAQVVNNHLWSLI